MKKLGFLILISYIIFPAYSQSFSDTFLGEKGIRAMFYNCENLFDTIHDEGKQDLDFTANGNYFWTKSRYWQKQQKIAKVITAVGGWEAPTLVGLAEIENEHVLVNLVKNTSLATHHYNFVHYESPDARGIDVGLLYRPEKFWLVSSRAVPICFPFDTASKTRDILYVKGVVLDKDTLHVFINHFPSRLGGQSLSQPKRNFVASVLKDLTDSVLEKNPCAKILIMGDFNDNPTDESIAISLGAKSVEEFNSAKLIDLMNSKVNPLKTHFYRGSTGIEWSALDQIIVSSSLFGICEGIRTDRANVFQADFLMEEDEYANKIPKRTFIGMKYNDGFSDHLPVYVDLIFSEKP